MGIDGSSLEVDVCDDGQVSGSGRPDAPAVAGSGTGLAGLRERLALFGGTLCAGPRDSGGWQVRAVIPLQEVTVPIQRTST